MSEIELIVGGSGSGKSRYAQDRAEDIGQNLVFVATARRSEDQEMEAKIKKHQIARGSRWKLIEEPMNLSRIVNDANEKSCILIDCLTRWITNWLYEDNDMSWIAQKNSFLRSLKHTVARVIIVTNEIGMGVTPIGVISRKAIEESGLLNQEIASISDQVTIVIFGLPHRLK